MQAFLFRIRFWRDHRWAPDRMSAYLDGDLTARARSRVERHLGVCVECRRLLRGLRVTLEVLRRASGARGEDVDGARIAASVRSRLSEPG